MAGLGSHLLHGVRKLGILRLTSTSSWTLFIYIRTWNGTDMSAQSLRTLPEFNPSDPNTTAQEWDAYKRSFFIHLDALGLDEKPGKRKVGVLWANMGREAINIYDSFTWAPEVEANEDAGISGCSGGEQTWFKQFFVCLTDITVYIITETLNDRNVLTRNGETKPLWTTYLN